jgi:hypothetical protein
MSRRIIFEEPAIRLPQPPDPPVTPQGFVLVLVNLLPSQTPDLWTAQQWIYQQAFARAQIDVRPSLPERDLLGYWN